MSGTKRAALLGAFFFVMLLIRTAVAASVDVTTAQDLYAALSNQAVTDIVVQQNLDLQDSLFFTRDSAIKLARDVVVRGKDAFYPILNLRFIPSRVVILPTYTLTFDSVVIKRGIGQSLHLGLDIVSSSVNSTVLVVNSALHDYAGLPPEVPVLSVVRTPRSPDYPGTQVAGHHTGGWCLPRITTPIYNASIMSQQVCWANVLDITDVAIWSYALDTVDDATTPHYTCVVRDSLFVFEAILSWDCLNAYGLVYCNTLDGNKLIALEDQQDALLAQQAKQSHDKHRSTMKLEVILPSVLGGIALCAIAAALLYLHLRKRRQALNLQATPSTDTDDKWDVAEKAPASKGVPTSDAKQLASRCEPTTKPGIITSIDIHADDSVSQPLPVGVMHSPSGALGHTQGLAVVQMQLADEAASRTSLDMQGADSMADAAVAGKQVALHKLKALFPTATCNHVHGHDQSGPGTPDAGSRDITGTGSVACDSCSISTKLGQHMSLGLNGSAISGSMLSGLSGSAGGSGGSLAYGQDVLQPDMHSGGALPRPHASLLHSVTSTSPAMANINLDLVMGRDVFLLPDSARGSGRFGAVAEGIYQGQQVAVKTMHAGLLGSGATDLASFKHEVSILSRCHHPNVVRLLGASLSHPNVFLVEELLERSLDACAHSQSLEQALSIAHGVALGLAYLHPTIIHRDLKPANILLDASGAAKISDFGLARFRDHTTMTRTPEAGTVPYMAPECFALDNFTITDKADVFSLGVLMWELVAQKAPWEGVGHMAIAYNVHTLEARLPLHFDEQRCPARFQKLIQQCWDRDPKRRPAALSVVKQLTLIQEQLKAAAVGPRKKLS